MAKIIAAKLEQAIGVIIKGVIFFLPWFFLPWTSEYFEFNKQFLLWFFVALAILLKLAKIAAERQIKIKVNPLNLPVLIFFLLSLAAAIFSLDRFSSFFGRFGGYSESWFGLASLVGFYFLIINSEVADSAKKIIGLLKLLLYALIVTAGLTLASLLVWSGGGLTDIFSSGPFNPAGSSFYALAVVLSIASLAAANFLLAGDLRKNERIIFSLGLIVCLIILSWINFSLSWVLLLAGAGLMIIFRWLKAGLSFKRILNYHLLIPSVLILAAVLMLILPSLNLARSVLGRELPKEVLLDYGQSWNITKAVFQKNPTLGSGPGTFSQDFSLYRPAELNSNAFWQIRFDKSRSGLFELLATAGLLTWLAYFLIICLVIYLNVILIKKSLVNKLAETGEAADENYNLITLLATVFVLLFCSQVFFLTNTVLNFVFWLSLGLVMAFWQSHNQVLFREKNIDLRPAVVLYRLTVSVILILSCGLIVFMTFTVRFFVADLSAARAINHQAGLTTAIKLNPYRYNYRLNLAKLYLNEAQKEALKPQEQVDNIKIQADITEAISLAQAALALAPNSILPWETLSMIYRDIEPLTIGSEPWAVKYFSGALEFEPTNPILAAEVARAYLKINDLTSAEKYFNRSLELKADYHEAKFDLAKTYLKDKQDNQALILLNELALETYNPEVYYELGRYYYNHGEIDKAVDRFKLVLSLDPRQVNSMYSLAAAYEAKGDINQALKYYQQVFELDGNNQEVEKKIEELSK